ncbi:MAG: penicillin-binding protein 2 [Candidatus Andersenbacteria bacterium]
MNETSFIESTRPAVRTPTKRFLFLWVVLWISMAALASRSFFLQIVDGARFRATAEHNRVDANIIPAARGIIYDRHDIALVENISSTDLVIDPHTLPTQENEGTLLDNLSVLLPTTSLEDIRNAINKARVTGQPVLLAKAVDHTKVLELEEAGSVLSGTRLASSLVRKYPAGQSAAHVLGYTSAVTAQELEADRALYPTDTTGKQGIEKSYEQLLRGTPGIAETEINAAGKPQTNLGAKAPTPGQDIQLTLDIKFQEFIYSLFSERDQKQQEQGKPSTSGAVVALDPRSGEVLALVSYPSFDSNAFSQPALQREVATFFQDSRNPLFNRAVDGTFASGSVIKPFIASAALEEGLIAPSTTILSTGGISVGPWSFPDWKAGGHGVTNVHKAIAESVNTFFYMITGGTDQFQGLGVNKTVEYLGKFNWGTPTGIDLPSEASGLLPTPEWKEAVKGERWYIGDTYHLGIGQGDVLVTPLQIAVATAGLAEGSYIYQPHLVNTNTIRQIPLPVSSQTVQSVREGMRQTITDGSGKALDGLPIALAGKTGTAQVGGNQPTHAWFSSFGPYEEPELVLVVLLEKGGEGDKDAVPFAKEIWQWWAASRPNS